MNVLESSPNDPHSSTPSAEKLPQNQSLVPKRLGTAILEDKGAKSMNPQL